MENYGEIRLALLEDIAKGLGKTVNELVPWVDFDPITLDETAWRLVRPGNWTGD